MTDLFQETPPTDYLKELVGEGKKFKTVEDLARGKYEADSTIEIFKRKQDELRSDYQKLQDEYNARAKLEEYIDQMNVNKEQLTSSRTPIANEVIKPIEPKQIEDMIAKQLKDNEVSRLRAENSKSVENKLRERYGENYQSFLSTKTQELGLTKEAINSLAENTPKVLITALGLNEAPRTDPFQAPPRSTAFQPTAGQKEHTWSWYQELKRSDPKAYNDPKTTNQMIKDYETLGQRFEDGDFKRYGDGVFG